VKGVGLAAHARDPGRVLIGAHVLRSLEHQVLEQVRKAGAAGLFILRSHVVPDGRMHDGRGVVLEEHHLQPIWKRGHRVVELRWPDDRV
jgi:hypothetical protein